MDTPSLSSMLTIADELFQRDGFRQITLAQIAEHAHLSDDVLTYGSTAHIALAIYHELAEATQAHVEACASGNMALRYGLVMQMKLADYQTHQEAIAGLFAEAMMPNGVIIPAMIATGKRDPLLQSFIMLVQTADDAPSNPQEAEQLGMLLYTLHFLVLVFWLYDRTDQKQATQLMVDFLRDFLKILRPMMMMPLFGKAMTKLTQIMMLVFGGAKLVTNSDNR